MKKIIELNLKEILLINGGNNKTSCKLVCPKPNTWVSLNGERDHFCTKSLSGLSWQHIDTIFIGATIITGLVSICTLVAACVNSRRAVLDTIDDAYSID